MDDSPKTLWSPNEYYSYFGNSCRNSKRASEINYSIQKKKDEAILLALQQEPWWNTEIEEAWA